MMGEPAAAPRRSRIAVLSAPLRPPPAGTDRLRAVLAHRLAALILLVGVGLVLPARVGAAPPAPDYGEELGARLAAEVERRSEQDPAAAAAWGERALRRVGALGALRYATALAHNRAGDRDEALRLYDAVIAEDPEHRGALYDRAELRLLMGDPAGAEADLARLLRLPPVHWTTHFRLAQLAAGRGDALAFEAALMDALRVGFELRTLALDPVWRGWLDDPTLGPVLTRIITVYGSEGLLLQLRSSPQ